jgi:succinate dehydrogenase/fumarate reductase cytochrome b subunit
LLAKKYLSPVQHPAAAAIAVTVEAVRNVIVVLVVLVGLFVALAGLLFTLQGFGAVSGSPMSNTTTWSVLGPIIALIGIAIAFAGWVRRKR